MYIYHCGEMTCKNSRTGDVCSLILKEDSWGKKDYKAEGTVKDAQGNVKYKLVG
jgi:hypothetical protein